MKPIMCIGVLSTILITFASVDAQPSTKKVLLKLNVDWKDATLEFVLDDKEVPAKALQSPIALSHGMHVLAVLRNSELVELYNFDVGPNTGADMVLKRTPPPPNDDEPDFRQGLGAKMKPTESPRPPARPRKEQRQSGDWVQLFNGRDLAGWKVREKNPGDWHVENGILTTRGGKYGHLFTEDNDWTDVHLRIVAKSKGPGTGICLRAPFDVTPADQSYQIDITGIKKRPPGALTIAGRDLGLVKTPMILPDTWFTMDVIIRGHHIVTKINNQVIVDYQDAKKTYAKGHIVLRHPADKTSIQFKLVEARDLAAKGFVTKADVARPTEKIPPKTANYGRYSVHTIPLSDALARPYVMIARAPAGGFKLGWNDMKGRAHITSLGEDLKPIGADIILPETELRGLGVNNDGTILTLVFQPPFQVSALGLNNAGQQKFKTILSGAEGKEPGSKFAQKWWWYGRLETSGQDFAVHFAHFWKTMKHGTHQGGCFARLDEKGNKLQYNGWTVSHSIDQAIMHHKGEWFTASVGDAFPVGIPFINRSQKKARSLIYPQQDQREGFKPKTTHLSRMVPVGDDVGLAFTTRVGDAWHVYYAVMDTTGDVKRFVKLPVSIPSIHAGVTLAGFGAEYLLIWTESEEATRYAVMDATGRLMTHPVLVDEPMRRSNDLAMFSNGDVGWLTGEKKANEVKLVRVRR